MENWVYEIFFKSMQNKVHKTNMINNQIIFVLKPITSNKK